MEIKEEQTHSALAWHIEVESGGGHKPLRIRRGLRRLSYNMHKDASGAVHLGPSRLLYLSVTSTLATRRWESISVLRSWIVVTFVERGSTRNLRCALWRR
jgi:hypothetical protein